VPDTAATIADQISQKSHHDWIGAFLVSHREVRSLKPHQELRSVKPHQGAST
jgi:glutamine phosphoribosylpyrophosphate amidotransferase